jgi:hypothetical protein
VRSRGVGAGEAVEAGEAGAAEVSFFILCVSFNALGGILYIV